MDFNEILSQVYFGNSVQDYLWVVGSLIFGALFMAFITHRVSDLVFRLVAKKGSNLDKEELHKLVRTPLQWLIMMIVGFICTSHLDFPTSWDLAPRSEFGVRMVIHRTYLLFLCFIITWIALRFTKFLAIVLLDRAALTESKADDQIVDFLVEIIRIMVIVLSIFVILGAVFKIDIAALVAGLGIGGLALALAAKESLENLLASFTIFFDKPFLIGDLVTVKGITGTVEKIGFRSTRIRTLEKSYLTIPNLLMVNDVLDNLSMRTFRRVHFHIGVTYSATNDQIQRIVSDLQKLVDEHPHTNQDGKISFAGFGPSSLDIMVMYFIDTMDYSVFLDVKEEINLQIMKIIAHHKAEFAFPTQTIHIEKT